MFRLQEEIKRNLIHTRPKLQLFTLLGFSFGLLILRPDIGVNLLLTFLSWVSLTSGVTVFNSYYDKDTEPVAGLEKPVSTHVSMLYGSMLMKLLSVLIAFVVSTALVYLTVTVSILSVLYSHSYFRMKRNGYIAVIFNFIAGATTFVAIGFLVIETVSWPVFFLGAMTSGLFLASVYIMMQIHQVEADKKRGDTSLAGIIGRKNAFTVVVALLLLALTSGAYLVHINNSLYSFVAITVFLIYAGFLTYQWSQNEKADNLSHFKMMSRVTGFVSVWGNVLFTSLYVLERSL